MAFDAQFEIRTASPEIDRDRTHNTDRVKGGQLFHIMLQHQYKDRHASRHKKPKPRHSKTVEIAKNRGQFLVFGH